MNQENFKEAAFKVFKAFWRMFPLLLGLILLIAFFTALVPKQFYSMVFTGNPLIDPLLAAIVGSVSFGNPITSYIIGGELLGQGIGLLAVTAFILAWVTVGIIQFPVESAMLGKKFAIVRNIASFVSAVIIAFLTVLILGLL